MTYYFAGTYFGLAFTFLAFTCEIVGLSEPGVAIICWIEQVYVADEHLQVETTQQMRIPYNVLSLSLTFLLQFEHLDCLLDSC